MPKDESSMQDFDISEIARGRRITAVAATELERVPRRANRPPRLGAWPRFKRKLAASLLSVIRRF